MDSLRRRWLEQSDGPQVAAVRRMTPAQKLAAHDSLWATTRRLIAAGIRARHPELNDSQVEQRVAERVHRGTQ